MTLSPRLVRWATIVTLVTPVCVFIADKPLREVQKIGPIAAMAVFLGMMLLILLGAGSAILLLVGTKKPRPKDALVCAIIGLVLNSGMLMLGGLGFWFASRGMPLASDLPIFQQIEGEWEGSAEGTDATHLSMELNHDRSFSYQVMDGRETRLSGTWSVQNKRLVLRIEKREASYPGRMETQIRWTIDDLTPDRLVLGAANGKDIYRRMPLGTHTNGYVHTSVEGKFRLTFPSWPAALPAPKDGSARKELSCELTDGTAYFIGYTEIPKIDDNDIDPIFQNILAQTRISLKQDSAVVSDKPIRVNSRLAQEIVAKSHDEKSYLRHRFFIAGNHYFVLGVKGREEGSVRSDQAEKFLASFQETE